MMSAGYCVANTLGNAYHKSIKKMLKGRYFYPWKKFGMCTNFRKKHIHSMCLAINNTPNGQANQYVFQSINCVNFHQTCALLTPWQLLQAKINRHNNASDIHMSVHRNIIPNYSQQDATFLDIFISTDALQVSGSSFAHHQVNITVHTASGIVNQYCC